MIGEPPSNMRITDRGERDRWQHANTEIELTETADKIISTVRVLRKLAEHDTEDKVCAAAVAALEDTTDYLDDVITALNDGRLAEPGDAG
jgi:hypothetical protein